jgi:hypothetical protein
VDVPQAATILSAYEEARSLLIGKSLAKYSSGQIFWSPLIGCSARRRAVVASLPVGPCEFEPVLSEF